MGSTARAILTAKVNSHAFDDRVLLLDVPCKIGRAHKEDQVSDFHSFILKQKLKMWNFVEKNSQNTTVLHTLAVDNFDFTRKIREFFTFNFGFDFEGRFREWIV